MIDEHEEIRKYIRDNDKRIEELEKKVSSLDMEKKLKIDYMMKMNQLEKNDKTHQALYDKIFKEIAELKERDLQLRKIMRFWIARYPLKEKTIMDLLDSKEGIKLCQFELPKDSGGEKEVRARHSEFDERNVPSDDLSTHSKPPEYSLTQEDIDRLVKPFEEPREDEMISIDEIKEYLKKYISMYLLVKREDLIRIFELSEFEDLNYPLNEEMKKLKEEYSL